MAKKKKSSTPAMDQWRQAKEQAPDAILFFRMGDFYEMFYDDAVTASRLAGLTLTSRSKGENPIPMAGVPHHQCDRYVKEFIEKGVKVAICDQLENPAEAKGVVKRGVTRIVTPGTLVEDEYLAAHSHNFLAAVKADKKQAGLAYVDVSTGEFFYSILAPEVVGDELERIGPAETLLSDHSGEAAERLRDDLAHRAIGTRTLRDGYQFDPAEAERGLCAHFGVANLGGFGLDDAPAATGACGAILAYLAETQKASLDHVRRLRRVERSDYLLLDRATQRNLELVKPLLTGGGKTLLDVLDATRTGPGGRLLKEWLLRPLATLEPIRRRQGAVAELMDDHLLRGELRDLLAGMADLERILARVVTNRANGRDLAALARTAERLPEVRQLGTGVAAPLLRELTDGLDCLEDLAEEVGQALVDSPPPTLQNGGLLRDGVHAELDELRDIARGGKNWIAKFQADEQARADIPSLKVGFNKVFGYYIEVTKTHKDKVPDHYERKQTLVNAERYITPELKEYESKVLGAEERITALEYELFQALRERVAAEVERVQETAAALAALDALSALAESGAKGGWILPEVHEEVETAIEGGRHPVVESLLPEGEFVDNDLAFDPKSARILIITGPNMAGKSTYIRQAALLVILAQMGAPLPATSARVGLADRIFTRVGAADDLSRGQSTFMVEMAETANILNNATPRSLVILDEVGRGTSTFDGVSLAWAITEFLHKDVRARTLFATHYHELAELGVILEGAKNFNVAVRDWGGEIIFLHKIQPGSCDRSYGIQVGRLAGIPDGVIGRAREILTGLEGQAAERDRSYVHDREVLRAAARDIQLDLFAPPPKDWTAFAEEVARLDPDHIAPAKAHDLLRDLVDRARGGLGR